MPANPRANNAKTVITFIVVVVVLIVAWLIPCPEGLSFSGKMALGVLGASIVLWVAQPIPIAVTALLAMASMPLLGVLTPNEVWTGFISGVIFFVMASFGLTVAVMKTKIPAKLMYALLKLSRGHTRFMILGFMAAVYVVSAFISDITTNALFAGIAMGSLIEPQGWKQGDKSNFAKCLMIGVVYASTIGGLSTPVGSSLNIMILGLLQSNAGMTISFASWIAVCVPTSLLLLVIAWGSLVVIFKPEPLGAETRGVIEQQADAMGKFEAVDHKTLILIAVLFVAWLTTSWTGLDATVIAVLGLVALFLPGINLISWDEYVKGVSWMTVILIGGVQSVASGIQSNGAASWLVSVTIARAAVGSAVLLLSAAVILPLLRMLVPVGPAFAAIVFVPLMDLSSAFGVSAAVFAIMTAFTSEVCFLLGFDNNALLSYRYGTFTFGEFFRAGIVPTIGMMFITGMLVPAICAAVGL